MRQDGKKCSEEGALKIRLVEFQVKNIFVVYSIFTDDGNLITKSCKPYTHSRCSFVKNAKKSKVVKYHLYCLLVCAACVYVKNHT